MFLTRLTRAALIIAASAPLFAQSKSSSAPVRFSLELQGKPIGKADYSLHETGKGWELNAHFSYNLQAEVADSRQAQFQKNWEEVSESNSVDAGPAKQSLKLTANAARDSLAFRANASGQDFSKDFPLQPNTVVLANFDPSGLQVLLNMQRTAAPAGGRYQCFVPSGMGTMVPCTLTAAADGSGKIAGRTVPLKHWVLSLASVSMDVWADGEGNLMQAEVPSQSLAYTREGFSLSSAAATATAEPGPPAGVVESEVKFASDGLHVPGTLTMPSPGTPKIADRVPIAVLVQGSGVQDRDETVGQNKVFQQLAWGLAQRGVATLRYDRRPKFDIQSFLQHPDLDHEVVIDAASALAYCRTLPRIDRDGVFLVGHSLGAQLAPYIVQKADAAAPGTVRGYVLLAGVETPIDVTILRQVREMGKAQGASTQQLQQETARWQAIFDDARNPSVSDSKPEGACATAGYYRDWLKRDPASMMMKLQVPVLVLRGDFDLNVTHEDFAALADASKGSPGSQAEEFAGLNHLFMPVSGPNADELVAGRIAPAVLDTITQWILRVQAQHS